jgi:hypothetical protein
VKAGGLYERMWEDYNRAVKWRITTDTEASPEGEALKSRGAATGSPDQILGAEEEVN